MFNDLRPTGLRFWCQSCGANLRGKRFGLFWTRGIQPLRLGTSQGSMGRTASSSSSRKKKPEVVSNEVLPDPFVSAETLKACALIGLAPVGGRPRSGIKW